MATTFNPFRELVEPRFTATEHLCLRAIRWLHRDELAARRAGFPLDEYRRLCFMRRLSQVSRCGPEETWL